MTSNRTILAGLAAGIIGAVLLGLFVATGPSPSEASEPTVPVYVAAAAIDADTRTEGLGAAVRTADAPASLVPQRRVTDLEQLAGQRALRPIGPGEILTTDQFGAPGPAPGGFVVPDGYEAVSVETLPAPGAQGYVTPGAQVNVYGVLAEPTDDPAATGERSVAFTQLLLGHVEVLAVTRGTLTGEARQPGDEQNTGRIVLLLKVRPEDVPVLVYGESQGSLWFSLVNDDDPPPSSARITLDDLDPAARSEAVAEAIAAERAQQPATTPASDEAEAQS